MDQVSCLLYLEDICNLKKTGQPLTTPPLYQVGTFTVPGICLKKTGQPLATPHLDQFGMSTVPGRCL